MQVFVEFNFQSVLSESTHVSNFIYDPWQRQDAPLIKISHGHALQLRDGLVQSLLFIPMPVEGLQAS